MARGGEPLEDDDDERGGVGGGGGGDGGRGEARADVAEEEVDFALVVESLWCAWSVWVGYGVVVVAGVGVPTYLDDERLLLGRRADGDVDDGLEELEAVLRVDQTAGMDYACIAGQSASSRAFRPGRSVHQ